MHDHHLSCVTKLKNKNTEKYHVKQKHPISFIKKKHMFKKEYFHSMFCFSTKSQLENIISIYIKDFPLKKLPKLSKFRIFLLNHHISMISSNM
jgi:hypothetical protein